MTTLKMYLKLPKIQINTQKKLLIEIYLFEIHLEHLKDPVSGQVFQKQI